MSAALELRGVAQRFGATAALDGIDLAVPAGTYAVLLGPSGSGKTTLLSILGGFLAPTAGSVLIDGADVTALPPARRPTATVFQDYALFPHLSVAGNVGFGLAVRRAPRARRTAAVEAALSLVDLAGFGRRRIQELSGGQRQRVALARALAVEPAVLLLDEPLGALDVALRRQVQGELKALQRRVGTTLVHVTHDQEEAMALADLLVVMNQGRIEDRGPPDRVYLRPRTRFTATFLGDSNLIEGTVQNVDHERVEVATDTGLMHASGTAALGQEVTLAVRPEQLVVNGGGPELLSFGTVRSVAATFLGTHWRVRALSESSGREFLLHRPPGTAPRQGETFAIGAFPSSVALLTN